MVFKFLNLNRKFGIGSRYIFSGLLKTAVQTISGFVVLRWLNPSELGTWQSFTVFVGYLQILTLGTTSGLNRELPYYLGKGEDVTAISKLKAGGYYTTFLSIGLMIIVCIIGALLYFFKILSFQLAGMFIFAFSTAALTIQTNFLGATFRTSNSFSQITKIQLIIALLYILLIPLIYFFGIWGYISYQMIIAFSLFYGYYLYRPFKVKYIFDKFQIKELIKIGLPIYFWNYLAQISQSIPRTVLVIFGSPILVGLYSPAGSINGAMLNLPAYTNRYLTPKMSFDYGKHNDPYAIFVYARKVASILSIVMFVCSVGLALIIPFVFNILFPKYIAGIVPAQVAIFSGVFYSINALFHNVLICIKEFRPMKFIVGLRFLYIISFSYIFWEISGDLLFSVALGAVISEFFNTLNYYYFLNKTCKPRH